MMHSPIGRFLNPWKARNDELKRRFSELRSRDGDDCRRCRRPIRFDLPPDHDSAPALVDLVSQLNGGPASLDNLCLCHARCNAETADSTGEVQERLKRRIELAAAVDSRKAAKRPRRRVAA